LGRHDDGPDALEMVVNIASKPRARVILIGADLPRYSYYYPY